MKKSNACPTCDYKASKKSHLTAHINRVHKSVRNFACSQCDYKAYDKGDLETHITAIHRRLRNYACSQCDYKASQKGNLETHINAVHRRLKVYACSQCDFKASQKITLISHVNAVHRRLKNYRYACTECDYKAAKKYHLVRHIAAKHRRLNIDYQAQSRPNSDNHKNSVQVHMEPNRTSSFISSSINDVRNKETSFSDGSILDQDENAEAKEFVEDEKKSSVFKVAGRRVSDTALCINTEIVTEPSPKQCINNLRQMGRTDLGKHTLKWTEGVENSDDITVTEFDMKHESHSSQDTDDSNQQINCSDKHMNTMTAGASNQSSNDGSGQCTGDMIHHSYNEKVIIDLAERGSSSRSEHTTQNTQCNKGTITDLECYACKECRYETSEKEQLIRHINSRHSEEIKSLACTYCSFRASYKCHLVRHINGVHMDIRPHVCSMCDYAAKTKSNLKAHIGSVHKNVAVDQSSELISNIQKSSRNLDTQPISSQQDYAFGSNNSAVIASDSKQENNEGNLTEFDSKLGPTGLPQHTNAVSGNGRNQYNNDQATVSIIVRTTANDVAQFTSDTERRAEFANEISQTRLAGISCSSCLFRAKTHSKLMNHIREAHKDDCI